LVVLLYTFGCLIIYFWLSYYILLVVLLYTFGCLIDFFYPLQNMNLWYFKRC